ncbi:MAG: hypothetical protein HY841_12825 [Bacteroidetes bacterium]|nr:hypothetical protein [Bacteroidota bacterium]
MNTLKKTTLLLSALTILSSCITTSTARLQPSAGSNDMEVFMTTLPAKPYDEISYIEASGSIFHTQKALLRKLKQRAAKEGADALIQVTFSYIPWALMSIPTVEGVAIKYKK